MIEQFMVNEAPEWLDAALDVLRQQITQRPTARVRTASVLLAGSMLHYLPSHIDFGRRLFRDPSHPEPNSLNFPHLFVKLILIDIRSTIPELMATLSASSYSSTAIRLAASYDIVGLFLYILLRNLGEDDDGSLGSPFEALIPPDLLLKLRSDLSETFSLTLEYMRDRWDASIAGTAGLHPSAQAPEPSAATGPLPLTWDNPSVPPTKDPIILAGLRATALWLREDDNEMLRKQALGVLDMLLALYKLSSECQEVDFRPAVLTALAGVLPSSDTAVDDFLEQGGWAVLANDLDRLLTNTSPNVHTQDLVRALLAVVESEAVTQSRESWMQLISSAAETTVLALRPDLNGLAALEDIISVYQLAIAIYLKAPRRLQRLFKPNMEQMRSKATSIYEQAMGAVSLDSPVLQGTEDVLASLATLPA
jgi:Neurochondrin